MYSKRTRPGIDWTTVPPSDTTYLFTQPDDKVQVIYVYHDEHFRHIEVHWKGAFEAIDIAPTFSSPLKRKREELEDKKELVGTIEQFPSPSLPPKLQYPKVILVDDETNTKKSLHLTSDDLDSLKEAAKERFRETREIESLGHQVGDTLLPLQDNADVRQLINGSTVVVKFA